MGKRKSSINRKKKGKPLSLANATSGQTRDQDAKHAPAKDSGENENEQHPPTPIDVFGDDEDGSYRHRTLEGAKIRVGINFQSKIPKLIPEPDRNVQGENDGALLVWEPTEKLSKDELDEYVYMAKGKYKFTEEQALGLLHWHRYDIQRATQDLGKFTSPPASEEWTVEEKVLFEHAFKYHKKCFDKMRQMLPNKSMSSIINYYYHWKDPTYMKSLMDLQEMKLGDDDDRLTESQNDIQIPYSRGHCGNCGVPCAEVYTKDFFCRTCFVYNKNTGDSRPLTGPLTEKDETALGLARQQRPPPEGMNIGDLSMLAGSVLQVENIMVQVQGLEREVLNMKCRIRKNKQQVELLRRRLPEEGMGHLRPKETTLPSRTNKKNLELLKTNSC